MHDGITETKLKLGSVDHLSAKPSFRWKARLECGSIAKQLRAIPKQNTTRAKSQDQQMSSEFLRMVSLPPES